MTQSRSWVSLIVGAIVVALLVAAIIFLMRPRPQYLQGQIEAVQVNVSSKVPGRVDSIFVREGDRVSKGQRVARINSPEVAAKSQQANAAVAAAKAQAQKAQEGARPEEIRAARSLWQRASAAEELAATTYTRIQSLYDDGVVPAQRRDEAETNLKAAREQAAAAKAQYDMAVAGARATDRAAANALTRQAEGVVAEVQAAQDETTLVSPVNGEVVTRVIDPGELAGQGTPILTIVNLSDIWATFNIREDRLRNISVGTRFAARIPALDTTVTFVVTSIAPLADFATWRATNESGTFDLKTFEVKARPATTVPRLRPGMSVISPWTIAR